MVAQGTLLAGRYRLDVRLGAGGMGEVWRGEDTVLARTVAVKVLLPGRFNDPGFAVRFQGEARAMATVNHPGVVDVYDYGVTDVPGDGPTAFLVMEFVDGEPLDRLLMRLGRIAPEPAMELIAQAAGALQAVHERGIVHRDVKPGNLLVRPDGTLVLTDFGIARADAASRLTDAGMVLGTAAYCAPEQAEGQPVTPSVDVYALGIVAYECLAGHRPFDGDTPVTIALKHIREEPPPLPPDVPAPVRAVVEGALRKDPAVRWHSAGALSQAARQSVSGAGSGTMSATMSGAMTGTMSGATTGAMAGMPGGMSGPASGAMSSAVPAGVGASSGAPSRETEAEPTYRVTREVWQDEGAPSTGYMLTSPSTTQGLLPPPGDPPGRRGRRRSRKVPVIAGVVGSVVFLGLAAFAMNAALGDGGGESSPSASQSLAIVQPSVQPSKSRAHASVSPSASPSPPRRSASPSATPSLSPSPVRSSPKPSKSPTPTPVNSDNWVAVSNVMWLTEAKAKALLLDDGFTPKVDSVWGDGGCPKVSKQTPKAGALAPPKSVVKIVIWKAPCASPSPSPSPSPSSSS
ncbi:protein kinase [Streptosporangiaceae bacterium NEAU-GS5]|nr:protein kinase [Streptosporangiaceae bacterium NEAU-GS5]